MRTNYRLLLIVIFILLAMTACDNVPPRQRELYDSEDMIIEEVDSYRYDSREGKVEIDETEIFFHGFYGKESLLSFSAPYDTTIELDVEVVRTEGDFKLCLINPDNTIDIVANSSMDELVNVNLAAGKSRLVMVGRDAVGSIRINTQPLDEVKIDKMTEEFIEETQ